MPAAEDRQAKALEALVKVVTTMNENMVGAFAYIKKQIEEDNEQIKAYNTDLNQIGLDELKVEINKVRTEKAEEDRRARARYEQSSHWTDFARDGEQNRPIWRPDIVSEDVKEPITLQNTFLPCGCTVYRCAEHVSEDLDEEHVSEDLDEDPVQDKVNAKEFDSSKNRPTKFQAPNE